MNTNRYSRLALAVLLTLAAVLLYAASTATAQRKPRPKTTRGAAKATPKPTPIPGTLEAMGEPPPIPKLKPKEPPKEVNPGDVISVNTTEVMIPVTVTDGHGKLINNLTREDFRIFEDGRQQPLSDLALRQVPVDVVLMVDASSSVSSNLEDFRRAAEAFAAKLAADDRLSLIKFDDRVQLLQDWTKSRFQFKRALSRIEGGMFTRFNDALTLAATDQFTDTKSRRAIIVLSDGIDSGRGSNTLEMALHALLKSQVAVYVISNTEISRATKRAELDGLLGGSDSAVRFNQLRIDDLREGLRVLDFSEQNLEQLTAATGGRLYKPKSFADLDETYAEVADELRHQYAIYYSPLNRERDGSFRRVHVQMTDPALKALTRVGYFAPKS
ncbi:MAG TPA: VWA domain-containing protein [Pyrinomonadaceae bacterium]|nr:VWA domain-containing protein [Pyrinomonadaceae bacterium]